MGKECWNRVGQILGAGFGIWGDTPVTLPVFDGLVAILRGYLVLRI